MPSFPFRAPVRAATIATIRGNQHTADASITLDLAYEPHRDPYAVWAMMTETVPVSSEPPALWLLSREVLHAAAVLDTPAGFGDVEARAHGIFLDITLRNDTEQGVVRIPRGSVQRFIEQCYRLVPPGQEAPYLNLDVELARMLAS